MVKQTPISAKTDTVRSAPAAEALHADHIQESNVFSVQRKLMTEDASNSVDIGTDTLVNTARSSASNFIQRKCAHCEEEEKESVQRKPLTSFIQKKESSEAGAVPDNIANNLHETKGGGNNMDTTTKSFMENRFEADFANVKIHTGNEAVHLSRDLGAKAFTSGSDIYFNEGQYNPGSQEGRHLLAHELTHTIQQGHSSGVVQRKPMDMDKCLAQGPNDLLPNVGLLAHMHREGQLDDVLGAERPLLELEIGKSMEARRFVCEAGVPAMIALYDTRNAMVKLEVECARRAFAQHPEHYKMSVLNSRRDNVLPVGHTSFKTKTDLFPLKGAKVEIDHGRQVRILSEDSAKKRFFVRVISGPQHCMEGFVAMASVKQATKTSLDNIKKVTLVFFQNTERLGDTPVEVGSALAVRPTKLRVDDIDPKKQKLLPVNSDDHISLAGNKSLHTATEFMVQVRFESSQKEVWGFIPQKDITTDSAHRLVERRFFVRDVGLALAQRRNSIFVDVTSGKCDSESLPIEFFTGSDIVNGILAAHACTDKLIDEVHIVGHAGAHGMGGTGNISQTNGIYVNQRQGQIDEVGALTANDFAKRTKGALADNVRFWLHACSTADPFEKGAGFAEQLGDSLIKAGGHSKAIVGGLTARGPADKGIRSVDQHPFILFPSKKKELFK